jgi:hypothetical protein
MYSSGFSPHFARVDQAHEEVARVRSVLRLVKQRVLPVQNRVFQCPLADIVVQRGSRLTREQRQLLLAPNGKWVIWASF